MADKPISEKTFNKELDLEDMLSEGGILARLYLEVQGNDKEAAQKALEGTIYERMNAEPHAKLLEVKMFDIEQTEGTEHFSGVSEVKLIADDYRAFVNLSMRYGPTGIEILEPLEIMLNTDQMHAIVGDASGIMQMFSNQIITMLKDPERAALYKQMMEKSEE